MGKVYVCNDCGSPDVQGSAWIALNSNVIFNDEPPTDYYYCPFCDETTKSICLVDEVTGECSFHNQCVVKPSSKVSSDKVESSFQDTDS